MATIQLVFIVDGLQPLLGILITTVSYPPVSMKKGSRAKIRFRVPPIARAGSAATGTKNTLIHPVKLLPILLTLQNLLPLRLRRILPLQPRFNTFVLVIKISHIHHQILNHEHMRQRGDRRRPSTRIGDLGETREPVTSIDVHGAGTADPLATRSAEGEGRVDLVLDLDESVEDHGPTFLEIDLVVFQLRLRGAVRVPPVDGKGLCG